MQTLELKAQSGNENKDESIIPPQFSSFLTCFLLLPSHKILDPNGDFYNGVKSIYCINNCLIKIKRLVDVSLVVAKMRPETVEEQKEKSKFFIGFLWKIKIKIKRNENGCVRWISLPDGGNTASALRSQDRIWESHMDRIAILQELVEIRKLTHILGPV